MRSADAVGGPETGGAAAGDAVRGAELRGAAVPGRTGAPDRPWAADGVGRAGAVGAAPSGRLREAVGAAESVRAVEPPVDGEAAGARDMRWLAVRERLPVWVQARLEVRPRAVAAVAVVLAVAVAFGAQQFWSARPQPVTPPAVVAPAAVPAPSPGAAPAAPGAAGPASRVVVDVGGKVRDPGLRRLPAGSRVEDALAAAGGALPGADTTGLNRARVLVDGEQVLVGLPAPAAPPGQGGPGGPAAGPLSLGTATVEQLDALPGVGPVLARHIVDFRTARGGFRSVEELRQVNGIGERRFADLRKLVRP
ncbi:ComEA family DNA-binding protein [Streptomyces globosus]|uniref:ComEA family DNA-binding protein n=1 Tax=Streptomyces globosus TaxID=68209 RepID=UPI0037FC9B57